MSDKPTAQKALDAYEDAVRRRIPVQGWRFHSDGSFSLIVDEYHGIDLKRETAPKHPHAPSENKRRIPPKVRREVEERDGHVCYYCGAREGKMTLDHLLPWSRGGRHTPKNLVVACLPCNQSKYNRTEEEWRAMH